MPERKKISFSLPPIQLNNKLYLPLLVVLLVVAAYLLGVLTTKVSYLEGGKSLTANIEESDINAGDGGAEVASEPVDVEIGHLPILGDKDAPVTVIEFSDFQCPFCKALWTDTLPQIKKEYIDTGKVKFAYRHYPIAAIHPNAQKAAEASECANEQGNFWDYHDQIFKNQSEWESQSAQDALDSFASYANAIGLNGASLKSCIDSGKFADAVKKDLDAGNAAGVNGTPATFINGLLISGAAPFSTFKTTIDEQLK
ncbi:MAG: DsbA family protein [Patescibacteria group bacterium]